MSCYTANLRSTLLLGVLAAVFTAGSAQALDWPTRPVTVVVPIAAGGNTDMMARIGAEGLAVKFNRPFIVENRSSAGGAVGVSQVARSKPDGYTLLFAASTMTYLTPLLQKVDFDPDRDLTPITNIGTGAQISRHTKVAAGDEPSGARRLCQGEPRQAELCGGHANAEVIWCPRCSSHALAWTWFLSQPKEGRSRSPT